MKNFFTALIFLPAVAMTAAAGAQMPGVPGPVGPTTESRITPEDLPPLVQLPADIPHVLACVDNFGDEDRVDFFALLTITDDQLHYVRSGDLLIYKREDGSYSTNMGAQQWDCANEEFSLRDLSAAGRTFTTLTPLLLP